MGSPCHGNISQCNSDNTGTEARRCSLPDLLTALFTGLEKYRVSYCVLHSHEALPENVTSDLDIAVDSRHLALLKLVLDAIERNGYQLVQCLNYAVGANYFVFAWFDHNRLHTAAIDVITEHRRGGLVLDHGHELLAGRRRSDVCWISSAAVEFRYLLAKKSLKKSISARQECRLSRLVQELGEEQSKQIASRLFGRKVAKHVVEVCTRQDAGMLLTSLRARLFWTALFRSPQRVLRFWPGELIRAGRRWFQSTGLLVAVLGTDGAGKSTLVHELTTEITGLFRRQRRFHWRPALLAHRKIGSIPANPHEQRSRRAWCSIFYLAAYLLDYWLAYLVTIRPTLARSGLVIFDRYFDDMVVDPTRYRYNGPSWLARVLCHIRPAPQLTLLLDAAEEEIFQRKQELSTDELRRQRSGYLALAQRMGAIVLNASLPSRDVRMVASRAIVSQLKHRLRNRPPLFLSWSKQQSAFAAAKSRILEQPAADLSLRPIQAAGSCRLGLFETPLSSPHRFTVLPSSRNPRWLLPVGNRRAAVRAMQIYTPYRLPARVATTLLLACVKTGCVVWPCERLCLSDEVARSLEDIVAQAVGEPHPVFALLLGTSERLTLQVMRTDGELIGYIKIPLTDRAASGIRHEVVVLNRLERVKPLRNCVPKLLFSGESICGHVLFQAAAEGKPGPSRFGVLHTHFLRLLSTIDPVEESGSALVEQVAARWSGTDLLTCEDRRHGDLALAEAARTLAGSTVPCSLTHGDFAPWNTRVQGQHLAVFDWESAGHGPTQWDHYHFAVQVASLLRRQLIIGEDGSDSGHNKGLFILYILNSLRDLLNNEAQWSDRGIQYRRSALRTLVRGSGTQSTREP